MKKSVLMLMLVMACSISGCTKEDADVPQTSMKEETVEMVEVAPEEEAVNVPQASGTEGTVNVPQASGTEGTVNVPQASVTEETVNIPQASLATEAEQTEGSESTKQNASPSYDVSSLETYMTSVEEQSNAIKNYLEQDTLTQNEMNMKSQELYELWDKALNDLWGDLKTNLPEEEFSKLLDEQLTWITDKENAMEEAGKEVEGGSLHPLVVNSEGAKITEERVYEFCTILKGLGNG